MSDTNYHPSGELQGDTSPMPDRGTGTGFTGYKNMTDGMDTSPEATNRIVGISGATRSDPQPKDCADDPC